jgi:molecular chaperone GrpE
MTKTDHPTWPDPPTVDDVPADEVQQEAPLDDEAPVDELTQVTAERDDYLDQLQRSRAEFVNFKRRNEQERGQLRQFVARDVLAQFLPVIDDFERALATLPDDDRENGWARGFSMIQAKLTTTAERLGAARIDALGSPFDPSVHEAVATEPDSSGSHVVEVYQNGYRIGDVLVRPAMVKTGDAPEPETLPDTNDEAFDA